MSIREDKEEVNERWQPHPERGMGDKERCRMDVGGCENESIRESES